MNINKKAYDFALFIKSTDEFKNLQRYKLEIDKNKVLKRQLDSYINQKNDIYSKYDASSSRKLILKLDDKYSDFFKSPIVSKYIEATNEFNKMMQDLYSLIEKELLKK